MVEITQVSKETKISCLIYGRSKVGKTRLAATAPKPLILNARENMLSINNSGIDRTPVEDKKQFDAVIKYLKKDKEYKTIIFDSLSNYARLRFKALKKKEKKEMKTDQKFNRYWKYDQIYEEIMDVIDELLSLPQDLIVICKEKPFEFDGVELYRPLFPGRAIHPEIPYLFPLFFNMRIWEKEGKNGETENIPFLQTSPSAEYDAGDSSGKLEKAVFDLNMTKIFKKIRS